MFIFSTILSWLGSLLGGPFVKAALAAYQAKLASENTTQSITEKLAVAEIDLQAKQAELDTQYKIATGGQWWWPDHLMGYAVALYFGKLLVYDKMLGWGTTDPLAGWAGFTANLIVGFYFGKAGIENVLKIWKGR